MVSSNTYAALHTYFGQDQSPDSLVSVGGSAATAQVDFLSALAGVGIEDFESLSKLQPHDVKERKGKERKGKEKQIFKSHSSPCITSSLAIASLIAGIFSGSDAGEGWIFQEILNMPLTPAENAEA